MDIVYNICNKHFWIKRRLRLSARQNARLSARQNAYCLNDSTIETNSSYTSFKN